MRISLYGKEKCKNCKDAEDKLKRLRVEYTKLDFDELKNDPRLADDRDSLREAGVQWAFGNEFIPVFVIDGKGMSYTEAMKLIKTWRKNG